MHQKEAACLNSAQSTTQYLSEVSQFLLSYCSNTVTTQ